MKPVRTGRRETQVLNRKVSPWQSGLLATSALSAILFASSLLWQAQHQEWAFLLAFSAVWFLISISWSNVDYTDRTGTILARVVDNNFDHVHERLEALEAELEVLRREKEGNYRKAS